MAPALPPSPANSPSVTGKDAPLPYACPSPPLPFPILFLLYRFLYVCVRSLFLKFIYLFFLYFHVRVNALSVVYIITARSPLCSSRVLQHIIVHTNRSFSRGNFRCICTTDFLFTCTISRCLLHFFLQFSVYVCVCVFMWAHSAQSLLGDGDCQVSSSSSVTLDRTVLPRGKKAPAKLPQVVPSTVGKAPMPPPRKTLSSQR